MIATGATGFQRQPERMAFPLPEVSMACSRPSPSFSRSRSSSVTHALHQIRIPLSDWVRLDCNHRLARRARLLERRREVRSSLVSDSAPLCPVSQELSTAGGRPFSIVRRKSAGSPRLQPSAKGPCLLRLFPSRTNSFDAAVVTAKYISLPPNAFPLLKADN